MSTLHEFETLADQLEKLIANQERPDTVNHLSSLSAQALQNSGMLGRLDAGKLLYDLVRSPKTFPIQPWDNNFGHPGLTLVERADFRVDIIYWLQNTASIHKHVSCGAFAALKGRRLHLAYDYERNNTLDKNTEIGQLERHLFDVMHDGGVYPITPDLTHELFWIDKPAITISIRCKSHPTATEERPLDFMPPNVGYLPADFQDTSTVSRWFSGLQLLYKANRGLYRRALDEAMLNGDASFVLRVLEDLSEIPASELEALVTKWDAGRNDQVVSSLAESIPQFRRRRIFARMYFSDVHAQLLAALLWSGSSADELHELSEREAGMSGLELIDLHGSMLKDRNAAAGQYLDGLRAELS